jgi:hypothetical protein
MVCLDLLKQLDSRLRIESVIIAHNGLQTDHIDRAIDIQALPADMSANFAILAAFDPSVTKLPDYDGDEWHP